MIFWNVHPTVCVLFPLLPLVRSFTLSNIPSTISATETFNVDWTSDPGVDPVNITVIVYDATRTPACLASEISHYELADSIKDLSNEKGQVTFTPPHSGKYLLCAFSVSNMDDARSVNGESLFNSTVIPATLVSQTVTVTASSSGSATPTNSNSSQRNPHDGAIIGGTLGGFFALIALLLALFWLGRYRIVTVSRYGQKQLSREDLESEHRAVENFTQGGGLYPVRRNPDGQGWIGGTQGADSDERPPSYDSVHGRQ